MSLQGRIVCVTGASSGIGAACVDAFAEAGARLLLCARRGDRLHESVAGLRAAGVEAHAFELDVREREAVAAAFADLPQDWQAIDILVNNAGLSRGLDPIQSGLLDDWDEMLETNVQGLLYVSRAVLPGMIERTINLINGRRPKSVAAFGAIKGNSNDAERAVSVIGDVFKIKLLDDGP